jgi:hypothetical protein
VATRADVQKVLVRELGPFLGVAGLDGETQDTPNDSMENAIGRAIVDSGGTVASPPEVTDADVATVTGGFYKFMLLCQFYLLDTIWGNWPYVDQRDGDTEQKLNQLAQRLTEKQDAILKQLTDPEIIGALKLPGRPIIGTIKPGSNPFQVLNPFHPFLR